MVGIVAACPFLLAAGLLMILKAGADVSDRMAYGTLAASVVALPAICAALYRRLPPGWPEDRRSAVAGLLAVPLFSAEVVLALVLLVFGMYALGFAPA